MSADFGKSAHALQARRRVKLRLRTKFLLSFLLISSALTCGTLLIVQHRVTLQLRGDISSDLRNSVAAFQDFQRQRELSLTHSAELLADLPNLRAMMTTQDAATIQDASAEVWRLGGSDLFLLADRTGKVVALHTATPGFTRGNAQEFLSRSLRQDEPGYWWYGGTHLYEVFLQPVYFGAASDNNPLGVMAIGYEINDQVARDISRVASSQVAFRYGDSLVVSTLSPAEEAEMQNRTRNAWPGVANQGSEIQIGGERFLYTSIDLTPGAAIPISLTVLKSFDQATLFLVSLNRLLLLLGLLAVAVGSLVIFLISDTITHPLASLVEGVRALEKGDFSYPLESAGGDEVAEVSRAFDGMRISLQAAQRQLIDAERLATIGRMASSISHDLRHPLTAVMANAEFLSEPGLSASQREELYREIRDAVDRMTDLVESLLEFSRAREHLRPVYGRMVDTANRAVHAVHSHPEFRGVDIQVSCEGRGEGWFDPRKMERVFLNLLLNACAAVPRDSGHVQVNIREARNGLEVRVEDNGPGIPEAIRDTLFQPFVSYGKENGTGLGLTVVQKIFQDHGGDVSVETTGVGRTVFKLVLPHNGLAGDLHSG
jgi:signal transduction histidine kinase